MEHGELVHEAARFCRESRCGYGLHRLAPESVYFDDVGSVQAKQRLQHGTAPRSAVPALDSAHHWQMAAQSEDLSPLELLPIEILSIVCLSLPTRQVFTLARVSKLLRRSISKLQLANVNLSNHFRLPDAALRPWLRSSSLRAIHLDGCPTISGSTVALIAEHGQHLTSLRWVYQACMRVYDMPADALCF
jgi:hypothetical protein